MKKKIAIALAVCLIILSIMAGPVFAKADKVALTALDDEPGSGFVIGNSCAGPASDQLSPGVLQKGAGLVRISLNGAVPNAEYEVWIVIPHPVLPDVWIPVWGPFGPLETNKKGNGNFIGEKLLGVPPGEAEVYYGLYRDDELENPVIRFVTDIPVTNDVKDFPPHKNALKWLQHNTVLSSESGTIADFKATFPSEIPQIIVDEPYVIDSRITLADALPTGSQVTVTRNGYTLPPITLPGAGPYWFTDLYGLTPTDFDHVPYDGLVEYYEITITPPAGLTEEFTTTVFLESVISKDGFMTWTVLDAITLDVVIPAVP